ncbi:MAG: UvrD-helicase domain-containing protein [Bacilli bacterium]|nr:UvrD-helicase domain-containing protein [Bacilli bacterium]
MPVWTDEQLSAINEENKNIIVSAGAGSGKTAVLTTRVIRKIKAGTRINELLILTFTNMAAKEMKERIKSKLKDEGLMDEYNLIDSSYITTFDSFSLTVVKKYHYLMDVSKNINVLDNSVLLIKQKEILEKIFDELYEKEDEDFIHLINDFCMKDDKNISKLILDLSSKLDLIPDKKSFLNSYLDNYYTEDNYKRLTDSYISIIHSKLEALGNFLEEISYQCEPEKYEEVLGHYSNLLIASSYEDIRVKAAFKTPSISGLSEEAKTIKTKINDCCNEIKELCSYNTIDEMIDEIKNTYSYVKSIISIILKLDEEIDKYKFENDLYTFNDIEKLAIRIVKENPDVREELKNSFKEIMIDEYQDTNNLQEEFISLIENNNVYMVGDIKQSIYRFRNANPNIFRNKYERYKDNNGGMKIDLNKNFRSREETLTNINLIFNLVMDNIFGGTNYLENQLMFGNKLYSENRLDNQNNNFEIYNYDYKKELGFKREEYEAFIIAKDIKSKVDSKYQIFDKDNNILRDAEYKDFVILMDRGTTFNTYKKIFNYLNIPLDIYKDDEINDDELFIIIKNIISLLISIKNNNYDNSFKHAYISLIRSFLYEYDDEKIFDLIKENTYKDDISFITLKEISNEIDYLPVSDILDLIVDRFDIINKLTRVGNIDNLLTTLEYIINYSKSIKDNNILYFNEYLDSLLEEKLTITISSKKEDSNSVKLMTIHKSKGLEYNICYYAGLYPKFNLGDLSEKIIYDDEFGICTSVFNEGLKDTIVKLLIKDRYIKEEISERIRLFYVALTRAKEKMILLCDMNGDEENNNYNNGIVKDEIRSSYRSFQDILSSISFSLKDYIKNINIEEYNLTKAYEIGISKKINIPKSNEKINVSEVEDTSSLITKEKASKDPVIHTKEEIELMEYGTKMHKIFEYESFNNPQDKHVIDFLNTYGYKNESTVYKELEFTYEKEGKEINGVIDLLIEYNDHIDIIDYKLSNIDDSAYIKQLKEYKEYISTIKDKPINIYLYSINSNKCDIIE